LAKEGQRQFQAKLYGYRFCLAMLHPDLNIPTHEKNSRATVMPG